jgi:glucose-1-phosphate adenylyltransferase
MSSKIISVIMGGGRGSRLYPLTKSRCKPAVPLAGKYRLVDISISNCLNAGLNKIYVLTQFNTASLHHHIQGTYKFDPFGGGFVDILSPEQTEKGENWYQGTYDAVRQNLHHFNAEDNDLFVILSGDQLYRMNFNELIKQHENTHADITIAAKALPISQSQELGLIQINNDLSIKAFFEKPSDSKLIRTLAVNDKIKSTLNTSEHEPYCLASMGIYVFNKNTLFNALECSEATTDFGKHIIPTLLHKKKLYCYIFNGYWEDIGTIRSFFEANLRLTDPLPPFNFFDPKLKIFTRSRFLPASKINNCTIDHAIISEGCIICNSYIKRSVIGERSTIGEGSTLKNVVMMGQDFFETQEDKHNNAAKNLPNIGIGNHCYIKNAIIDKNARIGHNVHLSPENTTQSPKYLNGDIAICDGILIVNKNAVIADNTKI